MGVYPVKVTTTGSAGSATGQADSEPIYGTIRGLKIDYNGSAPATTDVTITEVGGLGRTVLTRANTNTDGTFNPGAQLHDSTGNGIAGAYAPLHIAGARLRVAVAESDALVPAVAVLFDIEEDSHR